MKATALPLILLGTLLAGAEGWRIYEARQALAQFEQRELKKVRKLVYHPHSGQRDEVSSLVERILQDGHISDQEYLWLAGAMVHRYDHIYPSVAIPLLMAGYRTSEELINERRRLQARTAPLAWVATTDLNR